jgi:hypothetical protein
MRVDLRDGQWADLRERITHAEDKEIRRARRRARDNLDDTYDDLSVALRIFLLAGEIRDINNVPIDLRDANAVDRLPKDIVDVLMGPVLDLYTGATSPKTEYAAIIGRMVLGQQVSEAEIDRLSDPDLLRDAILLHASGVFTPRELEEIDALVLAVVQRLRSARKG